MALVPFDDQGGCPVRIGRDFPVRPRSRLIDGRRTSTAAVCRAKALKAQGQRLGLVAYKEARAMGHLTTLAFREQWLRDYDDAFVTAHSDSLGVMENATIEARFAERWAGIVVWAITLELYDDKPRYLARVGGYTATPALAIDDLEAIDKATQDRYAKQARAVGEKMRADFLRDLELERARRKGIDAPSTLSNRALRHINNAHDRKAA